MKRYLLSVCYPAGGTQPAPEALKKIMQDVHAVQREMQAAGAWLFSGGLHPANTATVVKAGGNGDVITTDGPFAETKEQLGGFWVINAKDLDEALALASRATVACQAPVEVRPFQDEPEA